MPVGRLAPRGASGGGAALALRRRSISRIELRYSSRRRWSWLPRRFISVWASSAMKWRTLWLYSSRRDRFCSEAERDAPAKRRSKTARGLTSLGFGVVALRQE